MSKQIAKVINLFGGPGVSKSTTAAKLFYELKRRHINVELTNEYAKWLTYEENYNKIKNQLYLFAKQQNQIYRLLTKVNFVIMDSPLILSAIYDRDQSDALKNIILHEHNKLDNLNYFIQRETEFQQEGRYHNLNEALEVDQKILNFLDNNQISYKKIGLSNAVDSIFSDLCINE